MQNFGPFASMHGESTASQTYGSKESAGMKKLRQSYGLVRKARASNERAQSFVQKMKNNPEVMQSF